MIDWPLPLSRHHPGLGSARRAAALQQIAQAKQSQDPSEVLALLRAAEKFFSGSRPQLTQQISNLEAEEAQFRQRLFKAAASASKPAQELEPEREPALPEPQPEPEAEPPEPATRSVEAQGQTDALMSFSPESKPKKRKQKPRKQHAVSWQVAEELPARTSKYEPKGQAIGQLQRYKELKLWRVLRYLQVQDGFFAVGAMNAAALSWRNEHGAGSLPSAEHLSACVRTKVLAR